MLLLGAKSHDRFDHGTVVPTTVEEDDFTLVRQLANVSLKIPLASFFVGRPGSATTRIARGFRCWVKRRIVPPFPAASRPSTRIAIRAPVCCTHR